MFLERRNYVTKKEELYHEGRGIMTQKQKRKWGIISQRVGNVSRK